MADKDEFLAQLRGAWRTTIEEDGGHCPCCDRWGKIYSRTLNKTMAKSLVWLTKHSLNGEWVDVPMRAPRWLVRSNQLPTLRWWGLVERHGNDDPTQKHSGLWRATPKGVEFVRARIVVPKKVYTYNAEPLEFGDEMVGIKDCIDKFSYAEVMEDSYAA